jgi:hypothetical protein
MKKIDKFIKKSSSIRKKWFYKKNQSFDSRSSSGSTAECTNLQSGIMFDGTFTSRMKQYASWKSCSCSERPFIKFYNGWYYTSQWMRHTNNSSNFTIETNEKVERYNKTFIRYVSFPSIINNLSIWQLFLEWSKQKAS